MILGPVFRSELTRTARRGAAVLRFAYGALLLALLERIQMRNACLWLIVPHSRLFGRGSSHYYYQYIVR